DDVAATAPAPADAPTAPAPADAPTAPLMLTRQQTADYLDTTIDALRNWEMNGLLQVKRKQNGYRVYTAADINRLAIIRALRAANYSLASILRLLEALDRDAATDIERVLDSPDPDDDILSVCDRLLTSLDAAERNAFEMIALLERMKENSST
uniref:MerR family transcriptional regulator n=1 Tax=Eggerthella sinensis TaxID=242230 RepID=UPI0022E1EB31